MKDILRTALSAAAAGVVCWTSPASTSDLLVLSAFPTEQALLLDAAKPVSDAGTFNGRRFFRGQVAGQGVVLGLTGIGMVNAAATATEAIAAVQPSGIVFSGVAGSDRRIGDVMVPSAWRDANGTYAVDVDMYAVASSLPGSVALDPCLTVEDASCTGPAVAPRTATPICIANGAPPTIYPGGTGESGDPFNGRAVPCLSHAGNLEGCEACGAPPNTDPVPGIVKFATEAAPFLSPFFFFDLFTYFGNQQPSDAVVVDMETAAVAGLASARGIPFIAFRALSDSSDTETHGGDPLMLPGFPVTFFVYAQLAADNAAKTTIAFVDAWAHRP